MNHRLRTALVGDRSEDVPAHRAIPLALAEAAASLGTDVEAVWVPTDRIVSEEMLATFDAVWCVPASPYRSMAGALRAIRWARENPRPFLGTCGGFQHALIEFARNVLGWADAGHAETDPEGGRLVIARLACELVEVTRPIRFVPGSRLATAYGVDAAEEGYRCRYGLAPGMASALLGGALRATAFDAGGEVRGIELDGHPFFVATLFQPERAALQDRPVPLARAFLAAALARRCA